VHEKTYMINGSIFN